MTNDKIVVDAKGLTCPMPLLKAKQALNKANAGEQVHILATDAGSMRDFKAFAEQSGHKLLKAEENAGVFEYCIEKKA